MWEIYTFKKTVMYSHRKIITANEASENAPVNIFYVKRVIYFHFKKILQSTGSLPNCNCKHIIRNCNNDLNVKKPHLLPRLLFAARILPFCIFLNKTKTKHKKKGQRSFAVLETSWEETACIHMLRHSSSRKQSDCIPHAAWKWLLHCVNPWAVFRQGPKTWLGAFR